MPTNKLDGIAAMNYHAVTHILQERHSYMAQILQERHSYMAQIRLLLVSSSRVFGTGYLDHAESEIRDHFSGLNRVLFVPYALADRDGYTKVVRDRFALMRFEVESAHESSDPRAAIAKSEAIFVGGGNTFRLLKTLYDLQLLEPIRERVRNGMPYMGSSAGTNVACPTVRTSNDMPIVEPSSLTALGVFPYQINPHYLDPDPNSHHMGETREQRLLEYLEENPGPVIALREGAMLRVNGASIELKGARGARIFKRGRPPYDVQPGNSLQL